MPFLDEAMPHYVASVHFYVCKFIVCFGMIKQLKYTISEVSKILVPLEKVLHHLFYIHIFHKILRTA